MRQSTPLLLALMVAASISTSAFGQTIIGSKHDFTTATWNTTGEVCVVCHTPHNGDTSVLDAPLWNHEVTNQSYTLYTSGTLDAELGQPDSSAKLCLSCHDGTVAVDNFGGNTSGSFFIEGDAYVGSDLSNDHPVSFVYDTALATLDGGLFDPATQASGLGGTIESDMLISGKMQCASCHDVHNAAGVDKLLRKSNEGSALCLTCHDK